MHNYKISDMKKGCFVGSFSPAAFYSENVEIAVKDIPIGTIEGIYFRKIDTVILYVAEGCIDVKGKVINAGEVVVWEPGEIISFITLCQTKIISIRSPGTAGDKQRAIFSSFEELDNYNSYYLKRLLLLSNGRFPLNYDSNISSKDVSVVLQGAVSDITAMSIASIRKYLPYSKIILSTWEGSDVKGLDYDKLILNGDPGCERCSRWPELGRINNLNRQIVSSYQGIMTVETEYAIKMRTDMIFWGDNILKCFVGKEAYRDMEYATFKDRIVVGELYTQLSWKYGHESSLKEYSIPTPFHVSDWLFFGRTEDLKEMFKNAKNVPKNELYDYKFKYQDRILIRDYPLTHRYSPEQFLTYSTARHYFPNITFDDLTDFNDENMDFYLKYVLNNYTILNFVQMQVHMTKYYYEQFYCTGISYYRDYKLISNKMFNEYVDSIKNHKGENY